MAAVDRVLMSGEQVLYRARLHWIFLVARPLLAIFVGFAVVFFVRAGDAFLYGVLALCLVAALFLLFREVMNYLTIEYVVTNKRVLSKVGWLSRDYKDISLLQFEGARVLQPVMGSLLDYGTVVVTGTGGKQVRFSMIEHPHKVRNLIEERRRS